MANFTSGCAASFLDSILSYLERSTRFIEKDSAGIGNLDSRRRSLEQLHTYLLLQLPNLPGERWLRYVQTQRRAPKAALFGDCNKISQVSQLHDSALRSPDTF